MENQSLLYERCYLKKFHFFKVLIGDFRSCLEIPPAFRMHIAIKRSGTATVKDQCGRRWKIELVKMGKRMMLRKGWETFVEENELRIGYFLVFQYDGGLHFTVTIFDTTACEKTICARDSLNCNNTSPQVGDRTRERKKDRPSWNVVNRKRNKVYSVSSKAQASVGSFKSPNPSTRRVSSHARNCKLEQKVIDDSGENITLAAWLALDTAWRGGSIIQRLKGIDISDQNITLAASMAQCTSWEGGSNLVQKLVTSNSNLVNSVQRDNLPVNDASVVPSQVAAGKGSTAKGIQAPEFVGRETTGLLMDETGVELEKNLKESEQKDKEERSCLEVPFDRCFHIYGGREKLEALEVLSSRHALQYNQKKTKLPSEKRLVCDGNLERVMQILTLSTEDKFSSMDTDKGNELDTIEIADGYVMKTPCDSSVRKVSKMAAEFATALEEVAAGEIIELTSGILEAIHSEGVRSLSKLCCFGLSRLLMFVQSIISNGIKLESDEHEDDACVKIDWPEDPLLKAWIIRSKIQSMIAEVTAVSCSFMTGILDVVYLTVMKSSSIGHPNMFQVKSIQEKARAVSDHLVSNRAAAIGKILDGLGCFPFVILSSSVTIADHDAR